MNTASLRSLGTRWCAGLASLVYVVGRLHAQMVTGHGMEGFNEAFGLSKCDWAVTQLECSRGANILWPGETATFTFLVKPGEPYRGSLKVHVIQYGTRGKPGDIWRPVVFKIAEVGVTSVEVDLPREGDVVSVTPPVGDRFGGYALIVELGDRGRAFGSACVRVPAAEPGREWLPTYALDLPWPHEMSPVVFNVFKRLGVKGARTEGGYGALRDMHVDWAMENDLTLMLTVGVASTPNDQQPLGRWRPFLRPDGTMIEGIKEDAAWLPSFDGTFRAYLKDVLIKHGWPKGPINAVELWNEPWEGVSISGWGADLLRYREIYRHMAQAVLEARAEAGVQVLIGGACSSSNTRDKLFCDGKLEFLPWLDFVSIHYQPMAADPVLEPAWMNREGPYGRVRVWDTESWVANSEDKVAAVIASMRAMGQDRTAGIYGGNVFSSEKPRVGDREYAVCQVWSPGAAVAAVQSFIGQRAFRGLLFTNGLPWVFAFDGLPPRGADGQRSGAPNSDDGTLVVVGDLGASYERNRVLFRSVELAADARLEFADGGGRFRLLDFYGNPVASQNGRILVPLHGLGYFLRTDGSPGSFKGLVEAVGNARISGVAPVEIVAHDFTAPLRDQPELRLRVTGVLNREVAGEVRATLDGLTLTPAALPINLKPHETRELVFRVTQGNSDPTNHYRLTAQFESATDGAVRHVERVHANVMARRSIEVDGALGDWAGAIPQVAAERVGASETEKAYLPFKDWTQPRAQGSVRAYLAVDDRFFYFAAEVPKLAGMIRFETRDDDAYFYPEISTNKGQPAVWPQGVRRYSYRRDPDVPSGNGHYNVQIAFNVLDAAEKGKLEFPPGTMPRFASYFDTDYEFALNPVDDKHGGGTEIFCLQRPGMWRKHFYPRQPKAAVDGGPVKGDARLVVKGNTLECRIPWSEMPEVKRRIDQGGTVKFSFRVNQGGEAFELAAGRSVSKDNPLTFHNDWSTHWANELEFGVER